MAWSRGSKTSRWAARRFRWPSSWRPVPASRRCCRRSGAPASSSRKPCWAKAETPPSSATTTKWTSCSTSRATRTPSRARSKTCSRARLARSSTTPWRKPSRPCAIVPQPAGASSSPGRGRRCRERGQTRRKCCATRSWPISPSTRSGFPRRPRRCAARRNRPALRQRRRPGRSACRRRPARCRRRTRDAARSGNVDLLALAVWAVQHATATIRDHPLELATIATGGLYQSTVRDQSIEPAIDAIGGELHAQYTLTYRPNEAGPSGYHEIKVEVDRRGAKGALAARLLRRGPSELSCDAEPGRRQPAAIRRGIFGAIPGSRSAIRPSA